MAKPLPCPFCGKEPQVGPARPEIEGNAWGYVECINERCPAQPRVRDGANCSDERGSAAYKALAVRRWNRRVSPMAAKEAGK
jgi:hypothetical protein